MEGLFVQRSQETGATDSDKALLVHRILEIKDVLRVCPKAEQNPLTSYGRELEVSTYGSEPEPRICPLCGAVYTHEGSFDPKDPRWDYKHPNEPRRMIEAHIIVLTHDG